MNITNLISDISKKKRLYLLIGAAIIAAGIFYFYHSHAKPLAANKISVEAGLVQSGDIPIQAQAIGTLTAEKSIEITPEMTGHVAKILFRDGTFVKQGTPLIQLDDKVYKAKLESAKANLFYSETNYNRMSLLGKKGVVAKQAVEQAFADLKEKKASAAESQVAVEKMQLVAPFDGMVGKSKVSPGNYVSIGQGLVSLVDTQHLRVEYSIAEKYLSSLKQDQEVKITTNAYPGKEFSGKVTYISPTINTENRTMTLYATIPNENNLLTAGLFVNITHFLGIEHNSLIIPSQSLTATIDGQLVYKIVDGKAVSTPVTIGQRTKDHVQIISGLTQNDKIVTVGQQKLKDGSAVEVVDSNKITTK